MLLLYLMLLSVLFIFCSHCVKNLNFTTYIRRDKVLIPKLKDISLIISSQTNIGVKNFYIKYYILNKKSVG